MTLRIDTLRVMPSGTGIDDPQDCDTEGHDPQGQGWMTLRIATLRVMNLRDGDG